MCILFPFYWSRKINHSYGQHQNRFHCTEQQFRHNKTTTGPRVLKRGSIRPNTSVSNQLYAIKTLYTVTIQSVFTQDVPRHIPASSSTRPSLRATPILPNPDPPATPSLKKNFRYASATLFSLTLTSCLDPFPPLNHHPSSQEE
jgi:hypothetical protein